MGNRTSIAAAAASVILMGTSSAWAVPAVGYVLGNGGTNLLRFNIESPGSATVLNISGAVDALDDLDFRPLAGQLYGYHQDTNQYVIVDPITGFTTLASVAPTIPISGQFVGLDFNPTIDRARLVTDADENVVFNPNNGATTQVTDLFYAPGDIYDGLNPTVVGNGYTNSIAGLLAGSTTQYVIDSDRDSLATLANNLGTLNTIGSVGLDFSEAAGFDVLFIPSTSGNIAYALLNVASASGLYTINLNTGEASLVGEFEQDGLTGLAIAPIPEPTSALLLGLAGMAMVGITSRRRRSA